MNDKLGKHKTLDKELKRSINWLAKNKFVTKIVLGRVESARHSFTPGDLRYKSTVAGGIKINAYGGKGVMDIFVKVEPIDKVEDIIKLIKDSIPHYYSRK